jgi:hypothetical protein
MRPLTEEERAYLYVHYEQAMETPLGSALTGNHWLLIAALNSLGYSANSIQEAYELCERLLWPSYYHDADE